ncbi:MAG: substrate-binding periplasmic protein [Rheinheimera sp.]
MISRFLSAIFCWYCVHTQASTTLTLYAYHQSPPFVINADTETGLNYDLIRALQQQLGDSYRLQYQQLPRHLLNERLNAGLPTIVLWANPAWFSHQQYPYTWSNTLFVDRDLFVTLSDSEQQVEQLTDLTGTLGALRGYRYPGVDELIKQHQLTRLDADSDKENLARLQERTVDQIVITRSSFLYYARQQQYLGKMKIVGQPYPTYHRQLLLTHHYQTLLTDFNQAILALPQQPFWNSRRALYGLKSE